MSDGGIFIVGLLVTLVVGAALALLVWGAILDGRTQTAFEDEQRAEEARRKPVTAPVA